MTEKRWWLDYLFGCCLFNFSAVWILTMGAVMQSDVLMLIGCMSSAVGITLVAINTWLIRRRDNRERSRSPH